MAFHVTSILYFCVLIDQKSYYTWNPLYWYGTCGRYELLSFTNFRRVSICLLNRLVSLNILGLNILQRVVLLRIRVFYHFHTITKSKLFKSPRFCASYTTAGLRQDCMRKKLIFNSYRCETLNCNFGYYDSFKDCFNANFSRVSIGKFNLNGYRVRNDSSYFVIMQWKHWHDKKFMKKLWKKTVRYSSHDALKIAKF